ncbi:serine acetyltransferase [Pantoea sp. LMR881]|uniref:serine acetyltransferase n=1 Tax=Pantoea sp. LMR881 TaxID=3014336 RepID=UPI0022B044C3|nr:serine acetyltransferase [Pantoea sp. LMR881]MCZ4058211.1 serine acetyltransferase [Pantoea sp. LMR881]
MKDLKIEYRDGQLIEFSIDGVSFKSVSAISFNHEVGETPPTVSISIPLGFGGSLAPARPYHENLQIIDK